MSETESADLVELVRELVAAELRSVPAAPAAGLLAIGATGRVPNVVDGQIIESAWGNAIRDRSVPRYDLASDLVGSDTLSNIAMVYTGAPVSQWIPVCRNPSTGKWFGQLVMTRQITHDANGTGTLPVTVCPPFASWVTVAGSPEGDQNFGTIWVSGGVGGNSLRARCYKMPTSAGGTPGVATGAVNWQLAMSGYLN